ncbi:MAG: N-acetyl-gamma-glutamyl-phosphate reductase [Thermodesulfobacterium geofontis]|uniref:N-acetyl-gamma-glutamyl-phosphate reductase n=1 Tax=Thermodesulfobacterium geofontis TaxID=1295609 RepID=A0A2N7PN69_9BACT|nr:MAG: N-acetyl-gamma-glutamyl-phosphate reductase [Thermodesulfobacterium geofontis]
MIKAAVIGATGYTGLELIRLSENHPYLEISVITSREKSGKSLKEVFSWNGKYAELVFEEPNVKKIAEKVQVAFLCVPSGKAQEMAYAFLQKGVKVIDFSADFRFKNVQLYESTYYIKHNYPELCKKAVYGLTEIFRKEIEKAELIANPGCYPTSALLPLIPLVKENLIEKEPIIIDSKSGTSGAGRKAENYYSFCEVNEDFKAYKIAEHRHNPEIEEKLSFFSDTEIRAIFTPHLLPINRGIFSTIYVKFRTKSEKINEYLKDYYKDSPFIEIVPIGKVPRIAEVKGTNFCKIGIFEDRKRNLGIIVSAIDNLIKGASGQALQNFNVMFGFPEDTALPKVSLFV